MRQALDLARENLALIREVAQLRRQLTELIATAADELASEPKTSSAAHRGAAVAPDVAVRLVVVLPRDGASKHAWQPGWLTQIPGCEVIVDRRFGERRRGNGTRAGWERRDHERRSHHLQMLATVVWARR